MAVEQLIDPHSYLAAESMVDWQYRGVEILGPQTALGQRRVRKCTAAANVVGVLQNMPVAGEAATVANLGKVRVVSDGSGTAIAYGDALEFNDVGKVIKAAGAATIVGFAEDPSAADGVIIQVRAPTFGGGSQAALMAAAVDTEDTPELPDTQVPPVLRTRTTEQEDKASGKAAAERAEKNDENGDEDNPVPGRAKRRRSKAKKPAAKARE